MKTRLVSEDDYNNILCGWWKDWRWTPPPFDFLPKTGVIVSKDGVDVCAGFVYFTNSKVAWIEFIVSNFNYKEKDRGEIINFTINILSELAKDNGFSYLYASLKNKSLIERYKKNGFEQGDSNCQEMIKNIWQQ